MKELSVLTWHEPGSRHSYDKDKTHVFSSEGREKKYYVSYDGHLKKATKHQFLSYVVRYYIQLEVGKTFEV